MITKEQAFRCDHVHTDGCVFNPMLPKREQIHIKVWRKNGAVKTWVRQPKRFRMPVKYGLYSYDYVDETSPVHLPEDCPAYKDYQDYLVIKEVVAK